LGGKKWSKSSTSRVFFPGEKSSNSPKFFEQKLVSLDLKGKKKGIFELKADDDKLHHKNWNFFFKEQIPF
jgi:hypothetical protein